MESACNSIVILKVSLFCLTRTDRIAARDVVLKGIFLPKGSIVVAPIYHIHRLEEFYPDPQAFIPER